MWLEWHISSDVLEAVMLMGAGEQGGCGGRRVHDDDVEVMAESEVRKVTGKIYIACEQSK